jgi:uncharacterized coiled-coil protein SlyX
LLTKRFPFLILCFWFSSSFAIASEREVSPEDLYALVTELQATVEAQQEQIASLQETVTSLQQQQTAAPAPAGPEPLADKKVTGRTPVPVEAPPGPKVSSRFDLSFYGYVKLDAAYDSQRTAVGDLAFFSRPDSGAGDDDSFSLTAKQTRFGMKVTAPEVRGWETRGRLEMDFYGSASDNAANPRMRLAFLEWEKNDWTILAGQQYDAWNTILPKTVNFATMGRHGALWSRRPQIRATRTVDLNGGGSIEATIGAARTIGLTDIDAAGDGMDGGEDSGLPMVQWNLRYNPGGTMEEVTVALGGHYGSEDVERNARFREESYVTSLLIGSVHFPLRDTFTLSGTLWTGENLGNWQGGIGQSLNLAGNTEIAATGGWIQASWYPLADLNLNVAYGLDDPKNKDLKDGQMERNETWFTNLYWMFLPSTTFAL